MRSFMNPLGDLSPAAAAQLLSAWIDRKIQLTEDEFEDLCDVLYGHIEDLRDERYRLLVTDKGPEFTDPRSKSR